MKKPGESDSVFEVKHRHGDLVERLQCAHANKLFINMLQCIRKSTHLRSISQQSAKGHKI